MTFFATFVAAHVDLRFRAEDRFFEGEGNVFAQISAALRPGAASPTSGSKHLAEAETEKIVKDVAEIDGAGVESSRSRANGRMPEAIIERTLLFVAEHGVGFGALLEFFFRVGIVRISIGMILQRELAIRALDFLFGSGTWDSEYLVVVAFYVTGQNCPLPLSNDSGRV